MRPSEFGGLPAPSFQPWLKGRNHELLPLRSVQNRHFVVIHGEVRHRAAELEQLLAGVAVALVLLDGVPDRLLGETVLQLERGDRQAVDEQAEVKRPMGLVAAVAELARDREAVLGVAFSGRGVAGRRCAVEKFGVMGPVLDPLGGARR